MGDVSNSDANGRCLRSENSVNIDLDGAPGPGRRLWWQRFLRERDSISSSISFVVRVGGPVLAFAPPRVSVGTRCAVELLTDAHLLPSARAAARDDARVYLAREKDAGDHPEARCAEEHRNEAKPRAVRRRSGADCRVGRPDCSMLAIGASLGGERDGGAIVAICAGIGGGRRARPCHGRCCCC